MKTVDPPTPVTRDWTATELAAKYGVTRIRVCQIARQYNIGHMRTPKFRLFSESDESRMRLLLEGFARSGRGRPRISSKTP